MDFISFINIKTPQLIGIILGCIVFWITIFVVVYLLYASGALSNVFSVKDSIGEINKTSDPIRYFPFFQFPRLYDNLLQAASTLPLKPNITHSKGKLVRLCKLDSSQVATLVNVSDGSAIFGESAYDPVLLWGWIESALKFTESKHSQLLDSSKIRWPSHSIEDFSLFYGISDRYSGKDDELHSVIVDMELDKPIGMISILHNNPKHLSASLGE